ncbi:neutral zinc metallopeptidase [Gordonia sp. VNK21]|uniref:neutral zinc metallopeptidase n=1 Tax=Gordonia sp. VNK21 TaxID=3382483 RepID=UPI0038D446D4
MTSALTLRRRRRTGGAGRLAGAAVALSAVAALLAGCTVDGSPQRVVKGDPIRCTEAQCPTLEVPGVTRVGESGVTDGSQSAAVTTYLTAVLDDLDTIWADWFGQLNIDDASTGRKLIEPGATFTSECMDEDGASEALTSDFPNAFYCSIDKQPDGSGTLRVGSVILPVQTFADIWDGRLMGQSGVMLGDFSAATIVAHEYGHHVMYRLAEAYQMTEDENSAPTGNNAELLADCFAGNWAATVFARKDLGVKDIAQAVVLMASVADPGPDMGHGTITERIGAMTTGFTGGQWRAQLPQTGLPGVCLAKYWPQALGTA